MRALAPTFAAALVAVLIGGCEQRLCPGCHGPARLCVRLRRRSARNRSGTSSTTARWACSWRNPCPARASILLKFVVLALMIAALTTITLPLYSEKLRRAASPRHRSRQCSLMVAACGLFLAPCLTILCRSTLAAVVFTIAIPGLLGHRRRSGRRCDLRPHIMPRPSITSRRTSSGAACSRSADWRPLPDGGCSRASKSSRAHRDIALPDG